MSDQALTVDEELRVEEDVDGALSPISQPDYDLSCSGHAENLAAYMHTISRKPLLTTLEEKRLARRVQSGCTHAKNKLIEHNMRLVIYNAKRFRGSGLEFEELIQEGTLGLIRAIEKFDPDQGYKLSTYATWWIRQKAGRAILDKGRSIRIPVHYQEQLRKLAQAENRLAKELCRKPSLQELATELSQPVQKVEQMLDTRRTAASLDAPVGRDGGSEEGYNAALEDFIADEELAAEVDEGVVSDLDRAGLRRALDGLGEPLRSVLILRYGLDGKESRTLQQIGDWLGISREVVRRYQQRAEKSLKQELSPTKARR